MPISEIFFRSEMPPTRWMAELIPFPTLEMTTFSPSLSKGACSANQAENPTAPTAVGLMARIAAAPPLWEGSNTSLRSRNVKAKNAPPPTTSAASKNKRGMSFVFNFKLDPVPIPGPGTDAPLFVGVKVAVADAPNDPCAAAGCADVESAPKPVAVGETVDVTVIPAIFVGARIFFGLGVDDGPPGRAVSVGASVSVKVWVGVEMGMQVGIPVAVGVRPEVQSGVLVRVEVRLFVFVGTVVPVGMTDVLVGAMGVLVGTMGVLVGATGVLLGITGGLVGRMGVSVEWGTLVSWGVCEGAHNPSHSLTPANNAA